MCFLRNDADIYLHITIKRYKILHVALIEIIDSFEFRKITGHSQDKAEEVLHKLQDIYNS